MNKLYVICKRYVNGEYVTEIEEVNIIKETPKQFTFSNSQIYRSTINKSDLNILVGHGKYLFTFDLELGTKVWNDYYTTKANNLKKLMGEALGYVI